MQTVLLWIAHFGYPALFSLLVLGVVGLPVPDETLLTFCGYLIYTGRLHPGFTFLTAFLGSSGGITISYGIGARFGRHVLTRYGKYLHLTPENVSKIESQFLRFGPGLLTIGYFIPGVRHFTAIVAGMTGLRYPKFALFAYVGAAVWVSTFLSLGYFFGDRWQHTSEVVHKYVLIGTAVLIGVAAIAWLVRRYVIDPKKARSLQ